MPWVILKSKLSKLKRLSWALIVVALILSIGCYGWNWTNRPADRPAARWKRLLPIMLLSFQTLTRRGRSVLRWLVSNPSVWTCWISQLWVWPCSPGYSRAEILDTRYYRASLRCASCVRRNMPNRPIIRCRCCIQIYQTSARPSIVKRWRSQPNRIDLSLVYNTVVLSQDTLSCNWTWRSGKSKFIMLYQQVVLNDASIVFHTLDILVFETLCQDILSNNSQENQRLDSTVMLKKV